MELIGPLRGLSQDYDEFLMNRAGALVSLLVALSRRRGTLSRTL